MLPEKTQRDQNEYKTDMIEVKKKNIIKKTQYTILKCVRKHETRLLIYLKIILI